MKKDPQVIAGTLETMTAFKNTIRVLALVQLVFAGFTAVVGAFADGGDIWSRLLVSVIHPVCAVAILLLALRPSLANLTLIAILAMIVLTVAGDITYCLLIASGSVKGDFWLPLVFAVIPAITAIYALTLLTRQPVADTIARN